MPLQTEVRDSRIEEEGPRRKVYRCEVCVVEDGEVVHRRQFARHLSGASIDQDYLQGQVDTIKQEALREAQNTKRIDPQAIQ